MNIFVDSGAFIALLFSRDQHHRRAMGVMRRFGDRNLVSSTFVLDEVATRGAPLVGAAEATAYINRILANPLIKVVDIGREILISSLERLVKYEDQGLSLTDCSNVVIMEAAGIQSIFTFDAGFRRIGLEMVP